MVGGMWKSLDLWSIGNLSARSRTKWAISVNAEET